MSVLCRHKGGDGKHVLFVKGAPESVLPRCTSVRLEDGTTLKMTDEWRQCLREQFESMATRPLRCLMLALKESDLGDLTGVTEDASGEAMPPRAAALLSDPDKFGEVEQGLTLVGMVGIRDPARPEVADSIARCRDAGVRVVMITGDSAQTAAAIARDVNILAHEDQAGGADVCRGGD